MADAEKPEEDKPAKGGKKALFVGLILALLLGSGGFYAVWAGYILAPAGQETADHAAETPPVPLPEIAFVAIPPLVVNVGTENQKRYLRFKAQLEVSPDAQQEVSDLLPRIVDVLNGYLRAIDSSELERKAALVRLRAQMLRRIEVVTGEGRVRDLLVMEFVLN